MSVFVSIAAPAGAYLLTDAATYDDDGVVRKIESKVWVAKSVPFAVTTRGHAEGGEALAKMLCDLADDIGVKAAMDGLQGVVDGMAAGGHVFTGANMLQVVAVGYVPGKGGVHRAFATEATPQNFDMPAFHVYEPPPIFATGPFVTSAELHAEGVPQPDPGEGVGDYFRRVGGDVFDCMRRRKGPAAGTGRMIHAVGGRCDFTIIDADGAMTETLRTWPDEVGQLIAP